MKKKPAKKHTSAKKKVLFSWKWTDFRVITAAFILFFVGVGSFTYVHLQQTGVLGAEIAMVYGGDGGGSTPTCRYEKTTQAGVWCGNGKVTTCYYSSQHHIKSRTDYVCRDSNGKVVSIAYGKSCDVAVENGVCGYNADARKLNPYRPYYDRITAYAPISNGQQEKRTVTCDSKGGVTIGFRFTTSYSLYTEYSHAIGVGITSPSVNAQGKVVWDGKSPYNTFTGTIIISGSEAKKLYPGEKISLHAYDLGYRSGKSKPIGATVISNTVSTTNPCTTQPSSPPSHRS